MKVFVIPSWYPSESNPIYGTFVKEQIAMMARCDSSLTFGVSLWGQGDDPQLLYSRQPIRSLGKLLRQPSKPYKRDSERIIHYYHPVYIWTKKIAKGNLKGIIAANRKNFLRFLKDVNKVDIIHVHASYPGAWIAKKLSEEFDIPYVVTLHMSPFPFAQFLKSSGALSKGLHSVLIRANKLIATSLSLKQRVEELGISNVTMVNNPVDLEFFKIERKAQAYPVKRLLSVGRLEDQKGFDILIEAISLVQTELELEIVGEGTEFEKLHQLANQLGVSKKVIFTGSGSRQTVTEKMQGCELYILSSRHETFGIVLIEAMACGKPVVATRCGGPESIVTEDSGLLCEPNDPQSLAQAIEKALAMEWDSSKIRQHVEDNFSPELFTKRMINVYQSVIS